MLEPTNIQAPSAAQLLLEINSRLPIFGAARKPFDGAVRHIVLFARAQDKEPQVFPCAIMTSYPMDSWQ
jgi:hypothetical protein